ncbi:cytochrome aa3 quinol oxidase subunit IV [Alicyclobacillus tolerans]|uniref:cytochrome aa3 quinol oxidase subunit IV n=1 Tax=Alicyclobacillus tolerans TaxID=90970 RepID=UPI001F019A57|nr:cytochrome aa3 quinol oxidase subunit IV [Alicyclobacillus tolerans]MCF8567193.1 cytochrome aa3 quinol oxidase subunit IV [Alicyclobacillus tolerans]
MLEAKLQHEQNQLHDSHEGFPWKHVVGFILSLVLTAIAFWFVLSSHLSTAMTIVSIVVLAIFQVLVQLLMFMHFTESDGKAYQVVAMLFGFFIAICIVGGTVWIMAFKSIVS